MTVMFPLMRAAVDYAGLFPPAGLPLDEVVTNYARYLKSGERSMLGRLIVPAMKLEDFEESAQGCLPADNATDAWRISALAPPIERKNGSFDTTALDIAMAAIRSFNERHAVKNDVVVDALEVSAANFDALQATIERLPTDVCSFVEVTKLSDPEPSINYLSQVRVGKNIFAKIRTGSVNPDQIPTPPDVARFIASCAKHDVGFKATAGLHHPIRGQYRLTYENDAPESRLFGFLNVFIATMIAFEHAVSEEVLIEILTNEDVLRFGIDDHQLSWGGRHVPIERVAEYRERAILSFGSCSFDEPVAELQQIPNVTYASVFSG